MSRYPLIHQAGLTIRQNPVEHIRRDELNYYLKSVGLLRKYQEVYGIQTQHIDGPYPWDVEKTLAKILK